MVRVVHFSAVPCANTRAIVMDLHHKQMKTEGKDNANKTPTIDDSSGRTLSFARSRSSINWNQYDRAEGLIEQHLPREVASYSGSLRKCMLSFKLSTGTLRIDISKSKPYKLIHKLHPHDGDGKARCRIYLSAASNLTQMALNVLQVLEAYIASPFTSSKAPLTRLLKESAAPSRAADLHAKLRMSPRNICNEADVGKYGWHFLRAEQIIDSTLDQRFVAQIKTMHLELAKLSISDVSDSVTETMQSKSKSPMIDYLGRAALVTPREGFRADWAISQ